MVEKGDHPPESTAPTSTSSIDTALPLDRSSSCCVRAVRAQALLERHGFGRLVVVEAVSRHVDDETVGFIRAAHSPGIPCCRTMKPSTRSSDHD
jgi:hypothetical protein